MIISLWYGKYAYLISSPKNLQAFDNNEDLMLRPGAIVQINDNVERVRRGHQNDVENIYIFVIAGIFYVLSEPSPTVALNLFRIFGIARLLHSLVYAFSIRQPTRALLFHVGVWTTVYMIVTTIIKFNKL